MWVELYDMASKYPGGDVSMVDPDGTVVGTFDGGGSINAPWGIAIDGNDNVWVADAFGRTITHLCGARLENCPPGAKTGDPISPPGGYLGGVQITTDVAIDPAGNVWVANNWDRPDEGFKKEPEPAYSTRFGGNGTVVFYGFEDTVDRTSASAVANLSAQASGNDPGRAFGTSEHVGRVVPTASDDGEETREEGGGRHKQSSGAGRAA